VSLSACDVSGWEGIQVRERLANAAIRAVAFLIVLTVVAVIFWVTETHPGQAIKPDILSALAPACDGQPVDGAGTVRTSGEANHLVILNDSGRPFEMTDWAPEEWLPASLADARLVVCVGEPVVETIEVCSYTVSNITRKSETRAFTVIEPATGQTVASFSITAKPRSCQSTERADLTQLSGTIDADMVTARLTSLVQDGVYTGSVESGAADQSASFPAVTPSPATGEPMATPMAVRLRDAIAADLLTAKGTGDGLQHLDLELESMSNQALDVIIPAGLMLDPAGRGTQTMVVVYDTQVELDPLDTQTVTLDVACAEMNKDQPTDQDTFQLSSQEPSADLALLLASPQLADADVRVRQFAIWTITDNPGKNGYMGLATGFQIFGTGPDADELDQIAGLFASAGIDASKYRALR
jgi:hypothetical protein